MKYFKLFIFLILISFSSFSQTEKVKPINYKPELGEGLKEISSSKRSRALGDTLFLPFYEDFSTSGLIPNPNLWIDRNIYTSKTYAIGSPSINVAVFDGLDSTGLPYALGGTQQNGLADKLTSKPFNLSAFDAGDSVFMSFYVQPQGLGNAPEQQDSFNLLFYAPLLDEWRWVWGAKGSSLQDFKQVYLHIGDSAYLQKGFQFRFQNYATISGDFDNWFLDYIFIDSIRSILDTSYNDIAFRSSTVSLLKTYTEMPWDHYITDPAGFTNTEVELDVRNESSLPKPVNYEAKIYDASNGNLVYNTSPSVGQVDPRSNIELINNLPGFTFPSNMSQPSSFVVENIINTPIDFNRRNDTIRQIQRFNNSFAYDDGSAEAAYGLNYQNASQAYQFKAYKPDVITAIAIYFSRTNIDVSQAPFRFKVWTSLTPEQNIYTQSTVSYPTYQNTINGFVIYQLTEPVPVNGDFYIGWTQTQNKELNIGLDRNNVAKDYTYYNIGLGWKQSTVDGALMIRPIFNFSNQPVGLNDNKILQPAIIYPNPASNFIQFQNLLPNSEVSIFNLKGELVLKEHFIQNGLNISHLPSGLYFIRIFNENENYFSNHKLMISR